MGDRRPSSHCSELTLTLSRAPVDSSSHVRTIELPSGFVNQLPRGRTRNRYSEHSHTSIIIIVIVINNGVKKSQNVYGKSSRFRETRWGGCPFNWVDAHYNQVKILHEMHYFCIKFVLKSWEGRTFLSKPTPTLPPSKHCCYIFVCFG